MQGESTTYAFAHLQCGVHVLLEQAEQDDRGCFYFRVSSMLLSALSLEAILNHIGSRVFDRWDDQVKRETSVGSKFRLLASAVNLNQEDFDRLNKTLTDLMRFRNQLAHAETESFEFDPKKSEKRNLTNSRPEWERHCTPGGARRFKDLSRDFIRTMLEAAGLDPSDIYLTGEGTLTDSENA